MIQDRAYDKAHDLFGGLLIRRMLGDEFHKTLDAELLLSGQMSLYYPVSVEEHAVTGLEPFGSHRRFTNGAGDRGQAPGHGRFAMQFPQSCAAAYEDWWRMPSVRPGDHPGVEFDTRQKTRSEHRTLKLPRKRRVKGRVHRLEGVVLPSIVTVRAHGK
jgi:hypothetical protein